MKVQRMIAAVYADFVSPPSKDQIRKWLKEYHDNFLLFVYKAPDGSVWGQWDVPKPLLGKYRKKRDLSSPAPPAQEFKAFKERYLSTSRNAVTTDDFSDLFPQMPESSGETEEVLEVQKISEEIPKDSEEFPHGVVVGIGVDVVKKQTTDMSLSAKAHPKAAPPGPAPPGTKPPDPEESPPKQSEAKAVVTHVFEYYLAELGRKKSQYELTMKRMKKGLDALHECKRRFPDGDRAERALGAAVDGLLANKFLMGANDRNRRYVDWIDHLFKDVETMEKRWEDGGFDANV